MAVVGPSVRVESVSEPATHRLTRREGLPDAAVAAARGAGALLAALLFASQRSIWAEAVVASIYPLNLTLVALTLWLALRLRAAVAPVLLFAGSAGLVLTHHRTGLFLLPGLLILVAPQFG